MKTYDDFLKTKFNYGSSKGMDKIKIHEKLFDFQISIVNWACKKGRAAIFADTGLLSLKRNEEQSRHRFGHFIKTLRILFNRSCRECKRLRIRLYV